MRLTLVIPALSSGGAERVMATLANAWAKRGWAVTLLTFDDGRRPPFYPLDPAIVQRPLDLEGVSPTPIHGLVNNLRRWRTVRRAVVASRPDAVVSFMDQTNVLVLLATRGLRLPVVVAEHNDPAQQPVGPVWERLRLALYPRAATVVMLSATAAAFFPSAIRRRVRVVPNPVVLDQDPGGAEAETNSDAEGGGQTLVAVGRLSEQKGFDLLLDAFSVIAPKHQGWRLDIWGEGPLRPDLERQRDALGLGERVGLPGTSDRLHRRLAEADLFVLSSRYEGFPMALCEAMASGLPVIAYDCPSGPREIVRPGIDGVLVPATDVPALAAALDRLMGDPAERRRLAQRAPEVMDRFGLETVLGMWDDVLREATR